MQNVELPIYFEGSFNKKLFKATFDNDFLYSCIDVSLIKTLSRKNTFSRQKTLLINDLPIKISEVILLDFYINGVCLSDEFMVVSDLSKQVVIGKTTMRKWRIKTDTEKNAIYVSPSVAHWRL